MEEAAKCRHCRKQLIGKPYHLGGGALHPITKERVKVNYYGGYVCSESCDYRASMELEQSMPGHGYSQKSLSCYAQSHYKQNWNS
jgi:hypothetical protein